MKLRVGDLVEILTFDHTSDDAAEGWRKPEDVRDEGPLRLSVCGYYVGEDDKSIKLAMARTGEHFSTFWYVLKNPHMQINKRRNRREKR